MTTSTEPQTPDHALAGATARLLGACASTAGPLGLGCAALAIVALLLPAPGMPTPLLMGVLAAVPVERGLALRLRFDAGLFEDLAHTTVPLPRALTSLDQALQAMGLRRAAPAPRALEDRARGARRLALWHAGCVALQCLVLVAGVGASRMAAA